MHTSAVNSRIFFWASKVSSLYIFSIWDSKFFCCWNYVESWYLFEFVMFSVLSRSSSLIGEVSSEFFFCYNKVGFFFEFYFLFLIICYTSCFYDSVDTSDSSCSLLEIKSFKS